MPDNQNDELDAKLLAQMLEDFLEESQETLEQLSLKLTKLEDVPEDEELINETFRLAHTLKGTASFVGLDKIREVAHKMEDVFGAIRERMLKVTASIIDVMFEALEVLTLLRDKAVTRDDLDVDISWIMEKLEQIHNQNSEDGGQKSEPEIRSRPAGPKSEIESIRNPKSEIRNQPLRVPTGKLDNLVNLVGELITTRNRLNEFSERSENDELEGIASSIDRLTGQLYAGIMSVRMVPIEKLFVKFPGVVRNLARGKNKEVEFILEGKETELDKTVIEQIYDPLVHLLRNSVDHGIESPADRQEKGKPRAGQIRLSAWHQENNVIIEVSDDGQGIDPEKMKAAAIQKGIITQEEASVMTDEQAVRLIFAPGFSTADEVTDVSGRGVGMDVVSENVRKLRGLVDVRTALNEGATFQIRIPLTLAVLQTLLVRCGDLTYALPLTTVSETLLIDSKEINTMEKNEVLFIRDRAFPFERLSSVMNLRSGMENNGKSEIRSRPAGPKSTINNQQSTIDKLPVVVVGLAEKRVALCVDELLGKQEVVMKSLGEYVGRVEGVEGAAIIADGRVTLIVDVEAALR